MYNLVKSKQTVLFAVAAFLNIRAYWSSYIHVLYPTALTPTSTASQGSVYLKPFLSICMDISASSSGNLELYYTAAFLLQI